MTAEPATIARIYSRAWIEKDFARLRAILADDVTFTGPFAQLDNAEDCIQGLQQMSKIVTDIVVHKQHTTVAPPVPTANWSHVENGKITRIRVTFDPRPLAPPANQ